MRFHVVSLPHTQTLRGPFSACAYTQKVIKFCDMMRNQGHTVFLYAGAHNDAPCYELVTCISEVQRKASLEGRHYTTGAFDSRLPHWRNFNSNAIHGIRERAQPHDFICLIGGTAQEPIADAFPAMMSVEFGIGYSGTFAKYRVWESYAWMHACYGAAAGAAVDMDGHWFDAVIPNAVDPVDFPYSPVPAQDEYYLFMGRLVDRKGFGTAVETCQELGARLVLAGPGEPPPGAEYVGVVSGKDRACLVGGALATFVPSRYIEPFGGVAVESMMAGTPVITTDWGAFPETVRQGVTGYRCRSHAEFVAAAKAAPSLDRYLIHQYAKHNYSTDTIGRKYVEYFTRLGTMWGAGYYEGKAT